MPSHRRQLHEGHFPKHYLRGCLCLLMAERPAHGYDLRARMHGLGLGGVDPSCTYKALRAMEREGLVCSEWEASQAGPSKRRYRMAPAGEEWLRSWVGVAGQQFDHLGEYLRRLGPVIESRQPAASA